MNLSTEQLTGCELRLRKRLVGSYRAWACGLDETQIDQMATACVQWTAHSHRRNFVGDPLRKQVKQRFRQEYGSIWTMLLFALIWEVIKQYLFN